MDRAPPEGFRDGRVAIFIALTGGGMSGGQVRRKTAAASKVGRSGRSSAFQCRDLPREPVPKMGELGASFRSTVWECRPGGSFAQGERGFAKTGWFGQNHVHPLQTFRTQKSFYEKYIGRLGGSSEFPGRGCRNDGGGHFGGDRGVDHFVRGGNFREPQDCLTSFGEEPVVVVQAGNDREGSRGKEAVDRRAPSDGRGSGIRRGGLRRSGELYGGGSPGGGSGVRDLCS